jgi:hypothetical protein
MVQDRTDNAINNRESSMTKSKSERGIMGPATYHPAASWRSPKTSFTLKNTTIAFSQFSV